MKIIKRGQIENYHKREHCSCEMIYQKHADRLIDAAGIDLKNQF